MRNTHKEQLAQQNNQRALISARERRDEPMSKITEEDFSPVYMDVRRHDGGAWPKIVLWALDTPILYGNMQVMVTVLQKQMEPYGKWTFSASIKPNDWTLTGEEGASYGADAYAEVGSVTLGVKDSLADCIDDIYDAIEDIQRKAESD